ncbi:MAG: hypothetical protein RL372_1251, partial [Bacteroidota bacterium]
PLIRNYSLLEFLGLKLGLPSGLHRNGESAKYRFGVAKVRKSIDSTAFFAIFFRAKPQKLGNGR